MINKKLTLSIFITLFANPSIASEWPVGVTDKSSTVQNQSVSIPVISNDIGNHLEILSVNESSKKWGRITINADRKTLSYSPYKDFTGSDSFWYVLKDGEGRTNAAKVFVNVILSTPSSNWPVANTDTINADYGSVVKIAVLENDTGIGLKLAEVNEWSVNKGKAWISADNEISYQQYGEARGDQQDEFWYVFEDQWGRKNSAKVVVSLKESNNSSWPVGTPDTVTASNGLRVNIPVLSNDIGSGLKIEGANEWSKEGGKTRIFGENIRYTPPADFSGTDSFWYQFVDEQGRTNSAKVSVEVSANTQKSVVEFCGNTYETDGTAANTQLSSLSPSEPVIFPSTEIKPTGVAGELGVISGRRYYLEGDVGSEQVLWMEVDGVLTKVSAVESDQPTAALGAYKGVFYFTQAGRYLFAHDGQQLVEQGDLLKDIVLYNAPSGIRQISDTSLYENTIERVDGQGDALHFSVKSKFIGSGLPHSYTTWWRISGDLDWSPVKLLRTGSNVASGVSISTTINNFYYFNGMDYFAYYYNGSFPNNGIREYQVKLADSGLEIDSAIGDVEKIIEDRGRLFVLTKYVTDGGRSEFPPIPSKLYVVGNGTTSKFVELATCPQ